MNDRHTTLYRLRDQDGRLLYIGISGNPGRRFTQHSADKLWWGDVADVNLEHYDTRPAALKAETEAIRTENPKHNKAGTSGAPHANGSTPSGPAAGGQTYTGQDRWTYTCREYGYTHTDSELTLVWEANCTAAGHDWHDDPHDAFEVWVDYINRDRDKHLTQRGYVSIWWFVDGRSGLTTAPFQHEDRQIRPGQDFLTDFTWPQHETTGDYVNFARLPIDHGKSWFIPEVVGWTPGPLTPAVHFDTLVELYNRCEAA